MHRQESQVQDHLRSRTSRVRPTRLLTKNQKKSLLTDRLCRLQKQDNADVQKLQMMSKWDPDTHDAILWLRRNKDKFRMEVFEPPFMSLSVKDRRYANAIEACFSGNQLKV